jgi:16S rRNA (adenine1518-N6/adenine1519-N6)-dimethyltransferase
MTGHATNHVIHRPLKRFGQHFLASPAVARRIVDAAGITGEDAVLEIGPGRGILTDLIAERAGWLVAVELDRNLARELAARYHGRRRVRIIQGDFLETVTSALGLPVGGRAVAVSNLPYNAAVPIMERLLENRDRFSRMVLMIQREVAWRMAAGPGTRDYGSLSVFIQAKAEVEKLFDVRPGSFLPPPKVVSTVVRLAPLARRRLAPAEESHFHAFVRACFSYRRKTLGAGLRQALKADKGTVSKIGERSGLDLSRRAESLSIGEFTALFRAARATTAGEDEGC